MLSLLKAGTTDAKRRHGRPIVCRSQKERKKKMERYDMMRGRIRVARQTSGLVFWSKMDTYGRKTYH
jgi:hypothetical protein